MYTRMHAHALVSMHSHAQKHSNVHTRKHTRARYNMHTIKIIDVLCVSPSVVREQRVTGVTIHVLIGLSALLTPILRVSTRVCPGSSRVSPLSTRVYPLSS